MALVRISRALISDVEGQCNTMRQAEINDAPALTRQFDGRADPSAVLLATEKLWGEHLHLKHQMPSSWLKSADSLSVNTVYLHDDGHRETADSIGYDNIIVSVPPGTSLGYNYVNGKHTSVNVEVPYEMVEQATADPEHKYHLVCSRIMEVVEREKRNRKIVAAWNARTNQIKLFLNKCKSLNEAIKLWPEVKLYVPKSYIDTVETAVVRSQTAVRKERTLENVDTDGLTAAAIAAKLAGVI